MKNKILFINACARPASRTEELSRYLLNELVGEITEVDLYNEQLEPLCNEGLERRAVNHIPDRESELANQFAQSDIIVIGAPFWDLSFPSVLKIYFENITISGITFEYSKGHPISKCKAKKLYYITTSGGYIGENNFGFDYVKALAENFFGISDIHFYSAEGLDIEGTNVKEIMDEAKKRITDLS